MNMKCVSCESGTLKLDTRDQPYTYKGRMTTLPQVTGRFCTKCDESLLGADESRRTMSLMLAFHKQVNADSVDPHFITNVRKKLALDQREAAIIFGGGVNAFSRYETGKTKPPVALVKLFQIFDRHPHLLAEVRA
jgi:HTH-type transcriptional regulator / antitoxin MqsA